MSVLGMVLQCSYPWLHGFTSSCMHAKALSVPTTCSFAAVCTSPCLQSRGVLSHILHTTHSIT